MGVNFKARCCDCRNACQCTPLLLFTWRGLPPWTSNDLADEPFAPNGTDFLQRIDAQRIAGTQYQWRIAYNFEDAAAERDRVLAGYQAPLSIDFDGYVATILGGPVRDGLLIALPGSVASLVDVDFEQFTRGGVDWPWRLEIGCVRCRCRGGQAIYWPIRHDVVTTPVFGEADPVTGLSPITGVEQERLRDADDYGRGLTDDEITRHWWHGGGPAGREIILTEPRRCPPTEIVWSDGHTIPTISIGTLPTVSALTQRRVGYVQTAVGWMSGGPSGSGSRERFDTVDLSQVNRITLIQPAIYDIVPHATGFHLEYHPPAVDPSLMSQSEIDALVDWLDNGPPRLLTISGCANTLDTINAFLSRFCSLRYERYAQTIPWVPQLPGITLMDFSDLQFYQSPQFVPTGHHFAGTATISTGRPHGLFWDQQYYPGVSGGETLYVIEYRLPGSSQRTSFPAVAVETRANGSHIVFAPQFRVWSPTNQNAILLQPEEVQTDSPYFDCNRSATNSLGWLGELPAALLDLHPPTVPRNASVTG